MILTLHNRISRRNGLRALAFGLVLLGICIFAWGLRYKLSLYDSPQSAARHMPAAKLLTGKERVEIPVLERFTSPATAVPVMLLALTLAFTFLRNVGTFSSTSWMAAGLAPAPLTPIRVALPSCWSRPPPPAY